MDKIMARLAFCSQTNRIRKAVQVCQAHGPDRTFVMCKPVSCSILTFSGKANGKKIFIPFTYNKYYHTERNPHKTPLKSVGLTNARGNSGVALEVVTLISN
jgi:hypothetical protein